jgi:hypothetical protein
MEGYLAELDFVHPASPHLTTNLNVVSTSASFRLQAIYTTYIGT